MAALALLPALAAVAWSCARVVCDLVDEYRRRHEQ